MSDMPVQVLVVDDDEVSREVLSVLLAGEGYSVESADSGDAALARLKDVNHALPAVVLVDMQMPGTRGGKLARQLRGVCGKGSKLLAMSASRPEDDAQRGFDGFLLKPFTMEDLRTAIDGSIPETAHDSNDGVLNDAVYRKLAASMSNVKLEKLYAMCLEDTEKRISELRRAAARGDDDTWRREAHAITGGCGMVGATEMQILATAMETKGIEANHVATLDEFLLASKRLRRILVARRGT